MFEAYGSTQPSTRDLYQQMFSTHGIPTPRTAVQQAEGMVRLDGNTMTQASTQGLYRHMFATHGMPTPHPPVQQPEGMVAFESKEPLQTSTKDLYRQMFTAHGRSTPITFQGSTPASASIPDLYRQMFTAHAERPRDTSKSPTVEPDLPRINTAGQARDVDVPPSGTAFSNGQFHERPEFKHERF